jgi:GTP-binding protein
MKSIVAIVGRPNVGKSTFFNRVTRSRDALVDDRPGVTRDRIYGDAEWNEVAFTVIDTGGYSGPQEDAFAADIHVQVQRAIDSADRIVMLLDGKYGVSPFDRDIVQLLQSSGKPVFFAVNKIDGPDQEAALYEFYALGIAKLYPLSAEHRYGLNDLLDDLVAEISHEAELPQEEIRLAVVGRPNVGKSSLLNRLLGEERHLVSDQPGTTRDAVDSLVMRRGRRYRLIDTAGIRRKGKVSLKLEKFAVIKALQSLDRCDVALIVIDAAEGITDQDTSVAGYAFERGCGCIFLLNKWDCVDKKAYSVRGFTERLREATKFLSFAPVLTVSALSGQRVARILPLVDEVYGQYTRRIGTGQLNRSLEQALAENEPPLHRGRRIKFYYATQAASRPPTFVMFVNFPDAVHFSYQRYLVNRLREAHDLRLTPLRLLMRPRSGRKAAPPRERNKAARQGKRSRRRPPKR